MIEWLPKGKSLPGVDALLAATGRNGWVQQPTAWVDDGATPTTAG